MPEYFSPSIIVLNVTFDLIETLSYNLVRNCNLGLQSVL